jgi:hypothetical protein
VVAVAAGAVNVLYGSGGGLTATGNQVWSQDSPGIAEQAEDGDRLGSALAIGDFNGDGPADLAVGVPGENLDRGFGSGVVHVLPGSAAGLTATGSQLWSQDSPGVPAPQNSVTGSAQPLPPAAPAPPAGPPAARR